MLARFFGAGLGFFAFSISVFAGMAARNTMQETLSRSILALFAFCVLGLLLGKVAESVVAEHKRNRSSSIKDFYRQGMTPEAKDGQELSDGATGETAA